MSVNAQSFGHLVENVGNYVRVTIPSKKHALEFVWFAIWLFVWGFMTSRVFLLWELMIQGAIEGYGGGFIIVVILCFVPFLLALLGMGAFAIHSALWMMSGKEIIEATHQGLTVTKQVFRWKWSKVYSSDKIHNLRPNTQKLSIFFPRKRVRSLLGGPGMITFAYSRRNPTFGLGITEEEAERIILALKDRLPQQNAG